MIALDLFSAAAGGWSLGLHRAGFRTIAACEVIPWRRALYAENNPNVKVYDDVRTLTAGRLLDDLGRLPDIVVGSPPCQDISSANTKGKGVEGERSGLYFEAIRIIGECRPRWFALENSANLRTRGADAVCAALEALGYACWPLVVRAGDIDANHERARCWLIGCDIGQLTDAHRDAIRFSELPGKSFPEAAIAGNDALHPTSVGHEGGRAWRDGPNRHRAAPASQSNAANADLQSGRGAEQSGGPVKRVDIPDDASVDGNCSRSSRAGLVRFRHGEVAGQMGLCPPDRGDPDRSGPNWSLAHLADHLRLDDGLSAGLAGARVDVGDGKGQSAASLIVEAFGDAVVPQIPEAIGRAILRTEAALAAIYGQAA